MELLEEFIKNYKLRWHNLFYIFFLHIILGLLLTNTLHAQNLNHDKTTTGTSRIENEYILDVPAELIHPLWSYIQSLASQKFLNSLEKNLSAKISEENFRDVYFDSPDFMLLKNETGIRHRSRFTPDDPMGRKNARQLIQMKQKYEDAHGTSREEIKYDVFYASEKHDYWDKHPLVKMIHPKERLHFFEQLRKQNILNPELVQPIFVIEQLRQRIYIAKNNVAYITITLDHSRSNKFNNEVKFYSMDIELNEIGFTKASPAQRKAMQKTNDLLWKSLKENFPTLVQDQTPKYTKTYNLFSKIIPDFGMRVFYPWKWRLLHLF